MYKHICANICYALNNFCILTIILIPLGMCTKYIHLFQQLYKINLISSTEFLFRHQTNVVYVSTYTSYINTYMYVCMYVYRYIFCDIHLDFHRKQINETW